MQVHTKSRVQNWQYERLQTSTYSIHLNYQAYFISFYKLHLVILDEGWSQGVYDRTCASIKKPLPLMQCKFSNTAFERAASMMTFYEGEMIGFLWTTSRDVPLSKRVVTGCMQACLIVLSFNLPKYTKGLDALTSSHDFYLFHHLEQCYLSHNHFDKLGQLLGFHQFTKTKLELSFFPFW